MSTLKLNHYKAALDRLESQYQELLRSGFKSRDLTEFQSLKLKELRASDLDFVLSIEPLDFLKLHNWETEWLQFFEWIKS